MALVERCSVVIMRACHSAFIAAVTLHLVKLKSHLGSAELQKQDHDEVDLVTVVFVFVLIGSNGLSLFVSGFRWLFVKAAHVTA